jgi:hypothetical protein
MSAAPFAPELAERIKRDHWGVEPLFIKGGAADLGLAILRPEFRGVVADLEKWKPHLVSRGWNGVVSAQNVGGASRVVRQFTDRVEAQFNHHRVWVDGTSTVFRDGGLGLHFDDKNNFVLQQSGAKLWRIYPPSVLSGEQREDKMNGGSVDIRQLEPTLEWSHEFLLDAGDLLYLPALWPHNGTSQGKSLSLSVVFPPNLPRYARKPSHSENGSESPDNGGTGSGSRSVVRRAKNIGNALRPRAWIRRLLKPYR